MIVISPNVALTAEELASDLVIGSNNPRIGWHNIITEDNLSSDEADAAYPISNLLNPATYLRWRGVSTDPQAITIAEAATVNYFAIAGHNLGTATLTFQASDDGEEWSDYAEVLPGSDNVFMYEMDNITASFFGLLITPGALVPEIAVLHVGRVLRLPQKIYVGHSPMTLARKSEVSTGRSENGQFLGRVLRSEAVETEVALRHLPAAWYRLFFEPFAEHSVEGAFFFAWRPQSYASEVGYAWSKNDIAPSNQLSNGMMQVSLSLQGIR
jgi:hypothetical protein